MTGFNAGAYAVASGLAVRRDGRIVAGGYAAPCTHFALAGCTARGRLDPRYTSRGVLDRSFGQGGKVVSLRGSDGDAAAVAIQRDGRIVAAGRADSEVAVAR